MNPRRTPRRLLAVALAAVVGLSAWAPAFAASGDISDIGWWTRNPGQAAPAGGFAVSLAPDGDVTVAAIRIDTSDELRAVSIVAVETGGFGQASAAISVCPAAPTWEAATGGALADAPTADCESGAIELVRDADSATWTAEVSSLVVGQVGPVSLAVLPTPGQGPLAAFDVRFAAPTARSVHEVVGPDAGSDGGTPDDGAAPAFGGAIDGPSSSSSPSPSSFDGFDPAPPSAGAEIDLPADDGAVPADEPAAAEGDEDETPSLPADDVDEFAQPLVPASTGGAADHRTPGRALLYVAMSALAGLVVAGGSRLARTRGLALG